MQQYSWDNLKQLFAAMLAIGEDMDKVLYNYEFDTKDLKNFDDIVKRRETVMKRIAEELQAVDLNTAPDDVRNYIFETEKKIREYEAKHLDFLKSGAKEAAKQMRGLYKQKSLLVYEKR